MDGKSNEMTENPRFFQLRQHSLILAANGKYRQAIKGRRNFRVIYSSRGPRLCDE